MAAKRLRLKVLLTAAALAAVVSLPVQAQDSTLLVSQMQQLLEEIRELRGMVESQQREIENLQRRQRAQFLDLDQRLQQLSGGAPLTGLIQSEPGAERDALGERSDDRRDDRAGATAGAPISDVPEVRAPIDPQMEITPLPTAVPAAPRDLGTPTQEEQASYDRAFRALREQRFADAAQGFSDFLDQYPNSSYAPNALYWLAETYYVSRDFETALAFFNQLRDRYPASNKDGDALLKVGFSHFELSQWNQARAALEQVRSEHPNTTLARLAETRLRDMRLAGHF
jgi:tol-pal system protein YbgF